MAPALVTPAGFASGAASAGGGVSSALFDTQPFTAPLLDRAARGVALRTLDDTQVKGCVRCRLSETRTRTVFGEGDPEARILFVGEGPGEDEDATGRPFVGRAGQLLDKMIAGMGLKRDAVYICNVVKCRPPANRLPGNDEVAACMGYLMRQIETVRPRVVVTLGLTAAKLLLGDQKMTMGKIRGQWQLWRGLRMMPTYHPAYLLRTYTREAREAVWTDLKATLEAADLPVPTRGGAGG